MWIEQFLRRGLLYPFNYGSGWAIVLLSYIICAKNASVFAWFFVLKKMEKNEVPRSLV